MSHISCEFYYRWPRSRAYSQNEGADRIRDAYPPATSARLRPVKRAYDPGNLFRFNQNIQPAADPEPPMLLAAPREEPST